VCNNYFQKSCIMTSNQFFTFPRFSNLLREEVSSGYRMTFIIASVVFAFLLLIFTINAAEKDNAEFHQIWYSILLFVGGFYFTSTSFNELNRKEERMNYLALPASVFEKFSMKLLITTVGYLVGLTLLYWVFAQVEDIISQKYFAFSFTAFNPFDEFYILMIKLYLVIQSVFILGAVAFNRFAFFKTLFALWLLEIALGIFIWILVRIIFAEYFEGLFRVSNNILAIPDQSFQNFAEFTAWPFIQTIFWYALAPVLWVVTYFKLKEREV
jgi:hypothetical protein